MRWFASAKAVEHARQRHCLSRAGSGSARQGQCLSLQVVETQSKGSVLATKAVETQSKCSVLAAQAVEAQGKSGASQNSSKSTNPAPSAASADRVVQCAAIEKGCPTRPKTGALQLQRRTCIQPLELAALGGRLKPFTDLCARYEAQ